MSDCENTNAWQRAMNANCRLVLESQECGMEVIDSPACEIALSEHMGSEQMQMMIATTETATNFVCRENVDGMLLPVHIRCYFYTSPDKLKGCCS